MVIAVFVIDVVAVYWWLVHVCGDVVVIVVPAAAAVAVVAGILVGPMSVFYLPGQMGQ